MKVVYSAPNRAHHYGYARDLHQAGMLKSFVCGFSRFSPRAPIPEIGTALKRVDMVQTIYMASLKLRMGHFVSDELAHWAKIQLDQRARPSLEDADLFLFYNGCGLNSARHFQRNGGITIVEAVNSHVLVQEQLLREEYQRLNLAWRPFHIRETRRRVAEVEEADYVLLPSTFVARSFLSKGISANRLLLVPYPMQKIAGASAGVPAHKNDDAVFRVLYVGSISVRKGLSYLIEAFRRLKYPKTELWIVGPVARPSGLENTALPEGVKFFGPLKGEALKAVYLQATVFCLPSIEEGLALVLGEALSHGVPVIATENTGIEDLLVDGRGGMTVPIRDAVAICDCLKRLAEDKWLLEKKRHEAGEWASCVSCNGRDTTTVSATLSRTYHQHRSYQESIWKR